MEGPFCPPGAEIISAAPSMGAHSEVMCVQKQGEGLRADALEMEQVGLLGVGKKHGVEPRDSSKLLCRALAKKGMRARSSVQVSGVVFLQVDCNYDNRTAQLTLT